MLFGSFDSKIIVQNQYHSEYLPFAYLLDLKKLKIHLSLKVLDCSPTSTLYHWFGNEEWNETAIKYKVTNDTHQSQFSPLIWNLLREEVNNMC